MSVQWWEHVYILVQDNYSVYNDDNDDDNDDDSDDNSDDDNEDDNTLITYDKYQKQYHNHWC